MQRRVFCQFQSNRIDNIDPDLDLESQFNADPVLDYGQDAKMQGIPHTVRRILQNIANYVTT